MPSRYERFNYQIACGRQKKAIELTIAVCHLSCGLRLFILMFAAFTFPFFSFSFSFFSFTRFYRSLSFDNYARLLSSQFYANRFRCYSMQL